MTPPTLFDWLLRRLLPPGSASDSIRGDLLEELRTSGGGPGARLRYMAHATSIAIRYGVPRRWRSPHQDPPHRRWKVDTMQQDLKFAARSLVSRPSFSLMVIVTLALGIGAATGIFSIVDAILLRPLPFAEPDRLVVFNESRPRGRMTLAWPNYVDYHDRATLFESMAAYRNTAFTVLEGEKARRLSGRMVSARFLDVLGVQPQLGRTFRAEDDRIGAEPVAIISDRFWTHDLGADPQVIGRPLRTSESTFTIIGVLPPRYQFGGADDILVPITPSTGPGTMLASRGNHSNLYAVARLKPGIELDHAKAELDHIAADLARAYPNVNSGSGAEIQLLRDRIVERVEPTLVALMGAVGFLLLLSCANVANLLLARGAARQHELAIRTALGGSRWRLIRHLLAESTLLSLAGGALGIGIAYWLVKTLVSLAPPDMPRLDQVAVNQTSLLFALAASVMCGLLFGSFPALQISGSRGGHLLARSSRTSSAVAPHRTRRLLMAGEVALALVLLSGCGLMIRTMMELARVDPGFRTDHLVTARLALSGQAWNSAERRMAFYDRVVENVRRIPGVSDAALTLSLPIEGANWTSVFIVNDKPVPARSDLPAAAFVPISERYFQTMGIALRRGREFDRHDGANAAKVVIINDTVARRLWPGEDPIGRRLKQGFPDDPNPWREVIGIAADVKLQGVDQTTPMQVFMPIAQETPPNAAIVARTAVDPATLTSAIESAVQTIDPNLPVLRILPMTSLMSTAVATRRLSTAIFAVFAVVAILIAAVGLYGVVSHSVTERTREIGVRMALGAGRRRILALFVGQGLVVTVSGAIVGHAAAIGLSRWLRELVFGVEPTNAATLATVGVLLIVVSAIACYLPARRATRVDPLVALKAE